MLRGTNKEKFELAKALFESGQASTVVRGREAHAEEDNGLATNQARRMVLEGTGQELSASEIYAQQTLLLSQFNKRREEESKDDVFARIYQNGIEAGLNDELALEQAISAIQCSA